MRPRLREQTARTPAAVAGGDGPHADPSPAGSATVAGFCQDGAVRILRTLSGLTVLAVCLAGCGAAGDAGSPVATPQFVQPSATPAEAAPAPAAGGQEAGSPGAGAQQPGAPGTGAQQPGAQEPGAPGAAAQEALPTPAGKASQRTRAAVPSAARRYVFPVQASNVDFHTTHSKYPGTDIFADCGEKIVATTTGVVLEVSLKDKYVKGRPDGPNNGGLSVSIMGDDGVRYYGSHLSKVQPGIKAGVRVTAGQLLGRLGRTGNANNVCHLHYGISHPCAKTGDWKVRRGVVWPASYLKSWRNGGNKSPVAAVKAWKTKSDCKA